MIPDGFRLGVDFGTSNTTGALRWPDGTTKPLLFDGTPLLPSAVYADPDGTMLTGRDALHAARARPECFEPNPKRLIDDGTVLLGDRELPVTDLVTAVLARVAEEARRVTGGATPTVTLTYPAAWGPRRRRILHDAALAAGFGTPGLVAEPVAAASYFVTRPDIRLPVGSCAVVYDFGGGTFDASVVRRTATGFDVLADRGLDDAGGLDVDEALVAHLGTVYAARDAATWRQLTRPVTPADRRAARLLREDVRTGKEMLSRTGSTLIHVPLLDDDAPLGREQFEQLAGPVLTRTVAATWSTIEAAGITTGDVAAVFLVGGSSRIPLAATLLHRRLGVSPTTIEQPELVVAEGSLHASPTWLEPEPEPATVVITPIDDARPTAEGSPDDDVRPAPADSTDPAPTTAGPALPVHLEKATATGARQWRHLGWGLLVGGGSIACGVVSIEHGKTEPLTVSTVVLFVLYAAYRLVGPANRRQRIPYVLAGLLALAGVAVIVTNGTGGWGDITNLLPVTAIFGIGAGLLELAAALVGGPGRGRGIAYTIGVVLLVVGAADAPSLDSDSDRTVQAVVLVTGMLVFGILTIATGVRRTVLRGAREG